MFSFQPDEPAGEAAAAGAEAEPEAEPEPEPPAPLVRLGAWPRVAPDMLF